MENKIIGNILSDLKETNTSVNKNLIENSKSTKTLIVAIDNMNKVVKKSTLEDVENSREEKTRNTEASRRKSLDPVAMSGASRASRALKGGLGNFGINPRGVAVLGGAANLMGKKDNKSQDNKSQKVDKKRHKESKTIWEKMSENLEQIKKFLKPESRLSALERSREAGAGRKFGAGKGLAGLAGMRNIASKGMLAGLTAVDAAVGYGVFKTIKMALKGVGTKLWASTIGRLGIGALVTRLGIGAALAPLLSNPIGWGVLGVIALGLVAWNWWDEISEWSGNTWESFSGWWEKKTDQWIADMKTDWGTFKSNWSANWNNLFDKADFKGKWEKAKASMDNIWDTITDKAESFSSWYTGVWNTFKSKLSKTLDGWFGVIESDAEAMGVITLESIIKANPELEEIVNPGIGFFTPLLINKVDAPAEGYQPILQSGGGGDRLPSFVTSIPLLEVPIITKDSDTSIIEAGTNYKAGLDKFGNPIEMLDEVGPTVIKNNTFNNGGYQFR